MIDLIPLFVLIPLGAAFTCLLLKRWAPGAAPLISLAGARISRMTADREVAAASQRLAVVLGLPGGPASVAGDLDTPLAPPDLPELEALLIGSPAYARLALAMEIRAAEVALARTRSTPSLMVGAGVRRFEAVDDEALVFTVGLPLQVFDGVAGGTGTLDAWMLSN